MRILLIVLLIFFIFSSSIFSQTVLLKPLHPTERDTVTIYYSTMQTKAAFSAKDSLFVIIWKYGQDDSMKDEWQLMEKADSGFTAKVYIEPQIAGVKLWFLTLHKHKFDASSFMIYENNTPVRNAYRRIRNTGDSLSMRFEIEHHPDNFLIYIDKWSEFRLTMVDSLEGIIENDLTTIENRRIENPGKFYAVAFANAVMHRFEKCLQALDTLITKYPQSPVTLRAITLIDEEFRTKANDEEYSRLTKRRDKIIRMNPDSKMARYLIFVNYLTDNAYEEICKEWINDEPDNPAAYYSLAYIYAKNNTKLDQIPNLTEKTAELLANGKLRLYDDISGKMTDFLYPECYFIQAEAYKAQHQYLRALNSVKAADPTEPLALRHARMMEGELLMKFANYDKAVKAYLDAWNNGEPKAKEEIKKIYLRTTVTNDFDNYFAQLTKTGNKAGNKNTAELNRQLVVEKPKETAPDFEVTSINGKRFKLSELKGKVIVANFWFTGCIPCREEIPELNKLVDKYKDCIFLAFSLDDNKGILNRFLAKYPFRFNVIPDASDVTSKFKIKSFPSTVIISPEGNIYHFEVGGAKNINEVLSVKIDELLIK